MYKQFGVRLQDKAGDGDDGGSGDDSGTELTQEAFDALTADNKQMKTDNESMKSKMDELLGETKKAKAAVKETTEKARLAAAKKAQDDGNFEELYKSSEAARGTLQEEIDGLNANTAKDKCKSAAKLIATELAEGENIDLLSSFIAPRLKYSDNEVKIVDSNGQLTVSTVEDLKTEFQNNSRYISLLKGSQASGSGASGGKSGGATDKVMTRADHAKLGPTEKMKFIKAGGKLID